MDPTREELEDDGPGPVREVRFEHSPGRLDPALTGNLVDLNAAFFMDGAESGALPRATVRLLRERYLP